jgi:outer membrane receptor for ferric coprogen and ferric-rhodotorulic acid
VSSGVIPYGYGEVVFQRGFRSGGPLIDGQLDAIVVADSVSYDSYEVLKGPAAVLYGQRADLAGIILKHTKKPLPVNRRSVRVTAGEGGLYRGEVDVTGPIGQLGAVPVSYRVILASQKSDGFQPVDFDDRTVFAAGLKFDFSADTSLLLQADYFDTDNKGITNNFQNATLTEVYDGPGYDKGYKSRWSYAHFERWWTKATLTHRFSENWEAVATLTGNFYDRKDREVRNAANPDFTNNLIKQYFFGFNYEENLGAFQTDVSGRYELAGLKNQSSLGFSVDRTRSLSRMWLPGNIAPNFDTSITNPGTYDIAMPAYLTTNSSAPTRNQRINAYGYYMHTLELIEDKLSVVGGLSGAYLNTSDRNLTTGAVQDMVQDGKPRRLGAVFKPVPGLALFVNNSTAFRGQGARDFAGNLFPAVEGEVSEGGFKTSFADGRVSTTVSYFQLEVSNLPVADPAHPGFSIPAGVQENEGFEADIAVRPLANWSVIASLYSGDIRGVDGKRMASSINKSASLLTKYDFTADALKGLSVGASMFHSGDRAGAPWNAYTVYGAFVGYTRASWQVMVNLDNVTDEFYSPSGWGSQYMDVGAPRNAKVTFSYRF